METEPSLILVTKIRRLSEDTARSSGRLPVSNSVTTRWVKRSNTSNSLVVGLTISEILLDGAVIWPTEQAVSKALAARAVKTPPKRRSEGWDRVIFKAFFIRTCRVLVIG